MVKSQYRDNTSQAFIISFLVHTKTGLVPKEEITEMYNNHIGQIMGNLRNLKLSRTLAHM